MAAPSAAPHNAEPALPDERKKQQLPPKSYADAVEQEPPANGTNGTNDANGINGANGNGTEHDDSKQTGHMASVLRIVDTGAPETKDKQEGRPQFERQESKHEYSAAGLDDTPRTPPRNKHRKTGSKSSNSSQDKPSADEKESESNGLDKPKRAKVKDRRKDTTVFEKVGEQNGSKLISVKTTGTYEKQIQKDQKEAPKHENGEGITSGKKPGQRWERSAIRFAPLNVPLHRRLQTLVVLFHTLCIAICVSTFCFLCAIPLFWPLLIPYMIYCMSSKASTSGTMSHRSEFLRSLPVWSLFASYFPARLHRTQELPPTRKYIFGYHPHGIISMGAFAAFSTEALGFSQLFPGIKNALLTLDSNFRIPIYRDYALAMGLASVSKESCENLLSRGGPNKEGMGRAITIVVGGARESLDAQPYQLRLVLKRRKGFVKMAIRTGADLVPVLAFGENDLYDQFQPDSHPKIHKFQLIVKKLLGFTIPLFHARGVFNYDVGLMPYRRPMNIVVGRPIRVVQSPHPDQEEIDRVHERYIQELERIWETWKDDFAPNRKEELQVLE
ncbi:diacylglycerol O-acyltransferas-like protein 2B [Hyaloscypha bicolor E]|uniref:diacylglycerol O-acyltransferase n=1 Tax=Hyaloscypha bicolor E TaxID=1095630 RepID=A0A2J6SM40_9HELO|nr:diacylglycerol O-acyltransferas-like protein 2B [Hyaloscypha bicolor E]PMD51835.1 diacylglycerol O-acyltransferas-like protein 2B [Hyaloscypha bicolor E]